MLQGMVTNLRPAEVDGAVIFHAWLNDQEVAATLIADRYPVTLLQEERFLQAQRPASFSESLIFAMETKGGRHIGWTSLYRVLTEDRQAALAVTIGDKGYWLRGFGGDAVMTTLRFGFYEMNLHRIWLTTVEYNTRAIACYLRCGFVEEARLRNDVYRHGRYWDFVQMGILKHEFERSHRGGVIA